VKKKVSLQNFRELLTTNQNAATPISFDVGVVFVVAQCNRAGAEKLEKNYL